ncbi:MAG: sulfatase, partial [Akkermansiaceae bacterium]|nr:sulfatase [Akkermansiaceae bacterium]
MRWRALLMLAVLVVAFREPVSARDKPNILLILTDDHRWDALSRRGHPFLKTPNLDRLAEEGVDFENAFVTTSLCSPSRASILTGLYAHNHGVVDNYHPVRDDLVFFPELLQKAGYETAFVGKWHMGDTDEKQRGFDHWVSFKGQGVYWPFEEGLKVKGRYVPQANRSGFNVNGKRVPQQGYITDEITDYAMEWLEPRIDAEHDGEKDRKPWFLYVSHKAVHADFLPPNRHAFKYDGEPFARPVTWAEKPGSFRDVPRWVMNQRNSRHGVEFAYYMDLDLEDYYKRYCETLLAVDESVGKLVDAMDGKGTLANTLVLYLGDNGFLFGEHGLIDKRCAYEESIRIPMLARWPKGIRSGAVVGDLVANIDVGPTLLSAAGVEVPEFMDG